MRSWIKGNESTPSCSRNFFYSCEQLIAIARPARDNTRGGQGVQRRSNLKRSSGQSPQSCKKVSEYNLKSIEMRLPCPARALKDDVVILRKCPWGAMTVI